MNPKNLYSQYNQINNTHTFSDIISFSLEIARNNIQELCKIIIENWHNQFLFILLFIPIFALVINKIFVSSIDINIQKVINILLISILLLTMAIVPYYLVDKPPFFYNWASRHQLLMGFAHCAAFYSYFLSNIQIKLYWRCAVLSVLIVSFSAINIIEYYRLNKDHWKQIFFVENIKNFDEIKHKSCFLIDDKCNYINA